jgi:hypothetical protein
MDPGLNIINAMVDQAFDRKSWHGTNLKGSIRGLTAVDAAWRPASGRHNIWEIVVHAAYWKYVVQRRLVSGKRGSFPVKGSNWFRRPLDEISDEAAWRADVALLTEMHQKLKAAIADSSPKALARNLRLITGIAAHDLYHAGQIQLLKRLRQ